MSDADSDAFHLSQTDFVLALSDDAYKEPNLNGLMKLKSNLKAKAFKFQEIDLNESKKALAIWCTNEGLAHYAYCSRYAAGNTLDNTCPTFTTERFGRNGHIV